jgi:hypothetical protein
MADDLIPNIETSAQGPKSASFDGGSAQAHSLPDQIAADKYVKASAALKASPLGIRYVKLRPGGAHDLNICDR